MKDKESIFKEAIEHLLENQMLNSGYAKNEEWKGYINYTCPNNYLKFIFAWNQDYSFYCKLGFFTNGIFEYEYSFNDIVQKLEKTDEVKEPIFGQEFSERIEEWVKEVSNQINKHQIQKITIDKLIIKELRNEYAERDKVYNNELQIRQTKEDADKAWNAKEFKLFIEIMKSKKIDLPRTYDKKLSIAEKYLK